MNLETVLPVKDKGNNPIPKEVRNTIKKFVEDDLNQYNSIQQTTVQTFENSNIEFPEQLKCVVR